MTVLVLMMRGHQGRGPPRWNRIHGWARKSFV